MPTFAELRNKAAKAADATSTKLGNTRDRMTSQPSKNINWSAEIKPKPPPPPKPELKWPAPPQRANSSTSSTSTKSDVGPSGKPPVPLRKTGTALTPSPSLSRSVSQASNASAASASPPLPPPRSLGGVSPSPGPTGPPPVIRRETRPDAVAPPLPPPARSIPRIVTPQPEQAADVDQIDWANLTPEDKEAFFSWLDEFFAHYLGKAMPTREPIPTNTVRHIQADPGVRTPSPIVSGPPGVATASRPKAPPRPTFSAPDEYDPATFTTSWPPHTEHSSAAEDLAHYFTPSAHWDSPWYTDQSSMMPPPLVAYRDKAYTGSWSSDGRTQTLFGGVIFADLSLCFYTVSWPQHASPTHDPNDPRTVSRHAVFRPPPQPWPRELLLEAHETYGESVAGFAESFEGTGRFCARGECWDLADEGLKYCSQFEADGVPRPVPCVSKTHGHLIYEAKATDKGRKQVGRWRGGDDRVRRGDIVQWLSARVANGPRGWSILGTPDHTAIVVSDMVPKVGVQDGMVVRPADMGTLEVVEQGGGKTPFRAKYDLSQFEEGEVWIYRPVGMEAYLGTVLVAKCPEGLETCTI